MTGQFSSGQFPSALTRLALTDGSYRTGERPVPWFASTFPSLAFYSRFARIVLHASAKAKRFEYDGHQWSLSSLDVLGALEGVGVDFEITGIEHIERLDTPCILIGNHMSMLETTILPALIWPFRDVTFVVKQSLMEYPLFGDVLRSLDVIVLSRKNARKDLKVMMEQGRDRLNHGISVVVFPQTTRSTTFDASQFNSIGCKLAARNGVPVVPVALRTDAWGIGERSKDIGRIDPSLPVHFRIGAPIWPQARGNQTHHRAVEFIEATLGEWGVPVA